MLIGVLRKTLPIIIGIAIIELSLAQAKEFNLASKGLGTETNNFIHSNKKLIQKTSYTPSLHPLSIFKNTKIIGRLHLDTNFYNEDSNVNNKSNKVDIRRIRIGIKGKLTNNFKYKFEQDFANNNYSIKDAKVTYIGIKNIEIAIGQSKPGISIQLLDSSNTIPFIERSIAVDDIPRRHIGFNSKLYGKNWQVGIGIFGKSIENESRTDNTDHLFASRASYAPINKNNVLIHLAIGSSFKSTNGKSKSSTKLGSVQFSVSI